MPSRTKAERDKHWREYQTRPDQMANNAARKRARRAMEKTHGKTALAGKDIDHKKPLRNGGSNGHGNLRVRSVKANRGDTR